MKPNVFVSFHTVNARQGACVETHLKQAGYQVKSVPPDYVAGDKTPVHIVQEIIKAFIDPSDVAVFIVGPDAAGKAYVDNELHHALKGGPHVRKGIVVLLMENTGITLARIKPDDPKTIAVLPERLRRNIAYAEFAFFSTYRSLDVMMEKALKKARDAGVAVDDESLPPPLRKGPYHLQ